MRRIAYILLVFLQVSLVLFSSTLEWMEKEEAAHAISAANSSKKTIPAFIESDLKDSEGLVYTQARERDSKPVEFIADFSTYTPWVPSVFISANQFTEVRSRSKQIISLLLTDLPPPSLV